MAFYLQVDSLSSTIAADGRYVCMCMHACVYKCVCMHVSMYMCVYVDKCLPRPDQCLVCVSVTDESYPPRPVESSLTLQS